ncbi:tetratricopeptide (TPR) repeat protein [Pseudarthrobacter defluvii]|uniref:AAA family ATPase n=1 Tax=Pseudarthrobacter defluvii TaxID=410837 RepID=UPI00278698FE|nr:ATP-binding protein [Pseudarthrobacter defluvii]MDQ0767330.1 tetratricopeptide (TPR) repeat protein [Pseudarthrobacter defluvii]
MTAGSTQGEMAEDFPLAGRAAAFEQLLEILRSVRKGKVGTVVLSGPSGSGKTALLELFLDHCRTAARGVRVLSAMGDDWEAQFALAGYSQLMRTLPLRTAKDYDGGPALAPGPVASLTPDQVVNYASTLSTHLEGLQTHGSVVVAVDDVHKLDEESLRILTFVMRRLHDKRVLFLLTLNPVDAPRVPAGVLDFLTGHQVARIPLEPLSPQQVQDLARSLFGLDLSATAAHGLVTHTGGIAQSIVELLRELPPETWQSWFPSLPPTSRVRARVRSVLAAASPALAAAAEAAAVLGPGAGLAEVARVGGLESVMPALDEGHRAGLLGLSVDQSRSAVAFLEPGTAEAVYEQIVPSRRISLHRKAAEVVQSEGEQLGHRFAATPAADEALATELEEFARRQAMVGAWQDASTALFSASRLSPDIRARNLRLLKAVDALVGSGNVAQAQAWAGAVDALPPSPLRSSVLGYLSTVSGQNDSAQSQLEMAWRTSNPQREPAAAAQVAQRFVLHGVASWDGPMITGWAERAMALTEAGTPAHIESEAIYGLGLYAQGRIADAEASYQRASAQAAENAQKQRVQMGAGWLALRLDNAESALVNFESAAPTDPRGIAADLPVGRGLAGPHPPCAGQLGRGRRHHLPGKRPAGDLADAADPAAAVLDGRRAVVHAGRLGPGPLLRVTGRGAAGNLPGHAGPGQPGACPLPRGTGGLRKCTGCPAAAGGTGPLDRSTGVLLAVAGHLRQRAGHDRQARCRRDVPHRVRRSASRAGSAFGPGPRGVGAGAAAGRAGGPGHGQGVLRGGAGAPSRAQPPLSAGTDQFCVRAKHAPGRKAPSGVIGAAGGPGPV